MASILGKNAPQLACIDKVDEPVAIIDHLHGIGCRSEFERLFEAVVVDAFQCSSHTPTGSTGVTQAIGP